jgi:hypothetical protein
VIVRLEYKYLVPNELLPTLRDMVLPFVELDRYAEQTGLGEYTVRSIYLDTLALDLYHGKTTEGNERKKVRIRGYNSYAENDVVFLEIKRKHGRFVTKNRAPVACGHVRDVLISGDVGQYALASRGFPDAPEDARRFLFHVHGASLRPVVLIIYEREAYYSKLNHSMRITLDKNVRSSAYPDVDDLFNGNRVSYPIPNHFVLEVKFCGGLPLWLKSIIGKLGLERMTLSKYGICLDTHRMPRRASTRAMLAFCHDFRNGSGATRTCAMRDRSGYVGMICDDLSGLFSS